MQTLQGKTAVVAGATRGAGRGIACMLGEAGAIVYCTGRSVRGRAIAPRTAETSPFANDSRPETIDETAEMVTGYGGQGIAVQVDHSDEAQVKALFERVRTEQGRLDILVNDVWGGDELAEWGTPFWELDLDKGFRMIERAVFTHIITARYGAPLMVERKQGLIVEITDGETASYRGQLFYDLVKASVIRLALAMSEELRPHNVHALAVTPGFLRSEAMLEHFGVTEANWREGAKKDPHFIASETPFFVGRAVAALAADANVKSKSGGAYSSWGLSDEYGFKDVNGEQPHWGRYFAANVAGKSS
jgi:NAD(P)-dependent dehydrogenase (short-subunit alcohol dehydrogenase family)